MKRWLYMCSLWVATFCVLLSTVVMHHHHYGEICMAIEQCALDGNLNDEHTEHHENEQEGCLVSQMHHFIINAKVVKDVKKHLLEKLRAWVAVLPTAVPICLDCGLVAAKWQQASEPLCGGVMACWYLRGPPSNSLL